MNMCLLLLAGIAFLESLFGSEHNLNRKQTGRSKQNTIARKIKGNLRSNTISNERKREIRMCQLAGLMVKRVC